MSLLFPNSILKGNSIFKNFCVALRNNFSLSMNYHSWRPDQEILISDGFIMNMLNLNDGLILFVPDFTDCDGHISA